jgi:hypothetical protein
MTKAIIGYSGFVGGNITNQTDFDYKFDSFNISDISGNSFDLLVIAAPSAAKWQANAEPEADLKIINTLCQTLLSVKAKKVIHISTVDVYKTPSNVNEDSLIDPEINHAYGKHRFYFETFIKNNFQDHLIVRLPGLFGKGLKKNFIFDMLNSNCLDMTHKDSVFQFYCLDNIWKDIKIALKNSVNLINFATEPLKVSEISKKCFGKEFVNVTKNPPVFYNMKSKYGSLYGKNSDYLYSKDTVINQLKKFIASYEI